MSGDAQAGSPRPRPLSGGFWTLLSWLRREERSSSNESLSSAGSDRTAVSFAFLPPAHYHAGAAPVALPPPGPPTDTYKNRVRERNLRRQYERDITLHRKYGLLRGEAAGGYDAFSLPPARRGSAEPGLRARRAASESLPRARRAAHVPGKRPAPPPPRAREPRTRKRPAPQPPTKLVQKENVIESRPAGGSIRMSDQAFGNSTEVTRDRIVVDTECKPKKYVRKEPAAGRSKPDRSFLKQIFENKKRYSAVDVSAVKVLPSISELDKQAAEIIENNKIKYSEGKNRHESPREGGDYYIDMLASGGSHQNASAIYTQTEKDLQNPTLLNKNIKEDEKQKLKDMLKEMKDSLPKRSKHEGKINNSQSKIKVFPNLSERSNITDTPTLRIGSSTCHQTSELSQSSSNGRPKDKQKELATTTRVTHNEKSLVTSQDNGKLMKHAEIAVANKQSDFIANENKNLQTPLKISSLLNPIYVPRKTTVLPLQLSPKTVNLKNDDKKSVVTTTPVEPIYVKTADAVREIVLNSAIPGNLKPSTSQQLKSGKSLAEKPQPTSGGQPARIDPHKSPSIISNNFERISDHSRRRELVNQLEQSIAKGDERAAAEAAAKLAQLRLSCSVLSFSSQILSEPSTSSANFKLLENINQSKDVKPIIPNELKNDKSTKKLSDPLPDLVKTEIVSLKASKSTQASTGKTLDVTTSITTPHTKTNEKNAPSPAKASTSKESTSKVIENNMTPIQIWIEDKEKARGPIQIHVRHKANVGELRVQAEQSLGLPARLQRWIVGRALCTDDNMPLVSLAGPTLNAPFYLCLVEYDASKAETTTINTKANETKEEMDEVNQSKTKQKTSSDVYSELVNLERQALVPNTEMFECEICMEQCDPGNGVILRECVHSFCKSCLSDVIRHCEEPSVACPATGCPGELHEREIRALVNADEYQRWLARGLAAAESGTRNAFHCRTRDCTGWALCELDVRRFPCPVCKHTNCVPCKAIHENETCEQYQANLLKARVMNTAEIADEGTQALIDGLISRGEALQCPECSAIITKKWGCDWVKCSACKTEICWVTRGRRWGPAGRGDTSGGCRCGVDGKRCHPTCGYCH